jgi:hypothetical protein
MTTPIPAPPKPRPAATHKPIEVLPKVAAGVDSRLDQVRSIFAEHSAKIYKHRYAVQLHVFRLAGGTPTDPNVTEGWIRTKMGLTSEEAVSQAVREVMEARSKKNLTAITAEQAMDEVARNRNLSGFKRDFTTPIARNMQRLAATRGVEVLNRDGKTKQHKTFTQVEAEERFGELHLEGRQVKAMFKEAAMVAVGAGHVDGRGWGTTRKGMLGFLAEHLFIPDDKIMLGVTDPTFVSQSFVHTWRGSGIKLEEIIEDAVLDFELSCDYDFTIKEKDFFKTILVVAEQNGLGASRSQGFGRFAVQKFEKL